MSDIERHLRAPGSGSIGSPYHGGSARQSRTYDPAVKAIPWWVVLAASAAPLLLIGGFSVATALQPASYNPVRDTISALAAQGATDSWVMTSAIAGVGFCYLIAAVGLQPARGPGRVLLAAGGTATLLIALFRQPHHGYSVLHELAVIGAALTCCTWSLFASHRLHPAPLLTRTPSIVATGLLLGLAAWYALDSHGALLGFAERCAAAAPPLWLLVVVITSRRALTRHQIELQSRPVVNESLSFDRPR